MGNRSLKKQIIFYAILGLFIGFILMGVFAITYSSIKQTQKKDVQQYLSEIVSQNKNSIAIKIDGNFQTLSALSTFIEKSDSLDMEQIQERLAAESGRNQFVRMGFVTPDKTGYFFDTDGTTHLNIDLQDESFVDKVLAGDSVLSEPMEDKFSDDTVNIYAVPVYHNDEIIGAITATASSEELSAIINQSVFNGNAYVHIIRSSGDFVMRSGHTVIPKNLTNVFDDGDISPSVRNEIMTSAAQGKDAFATFSHQGEKYWVTVTSIGINDWHLFCLVPEAYLSGNYNQLLIVYFITMACITVLFTILFLYIYQIIKKNHQEIKHLAYYDLLTGAYNRNKFIEEMPKLLSASKDYAFVFTNIKGFKFINEFYGYHAGNQLLKQIAAILHDHTGPGEMFCRDSSDRFGMLLHCTDKDDLCVRLKVIQQEIHNCKLNEDESYHIICNFGVKIIGEYNSMVNTDYDTVMSRALLALNSIKSSEIEYISFYDENLHAKVAKQTRIENRMWDALNNREFVMYLQPKYDLKTEQIHGAEALVRWYPENGDVIYPDEFIPVFEKNGFIIKLDMYMLEEACRQLSLWKEQGLPLVPLSVNQSRVFFYDTEYLDKFEDIINRYQIDPAFIILEVTEGVAMTNLEQIRSVMDRLHEMGFRISMDDFGSGYSSLNILKELPIDELKLDKVFLDDTDNYLRSETIMKGIISLARELSISTVTEGVETKEQAAFLKSISCDIAQGYYFAKPMPVEDFAKLAFVNFYE